MSLRSLRYGHVWPVLVSRVGGQTNMREQKDVGRQLGWALRRMILNVLFRFAEVILQKELVVESILGNGGSRELPVWGGT